MLVFLADHHTLFHSPDLILTGSRLLEDPKSLPAAMASNKDRLYRALYARGSASTMSGKEDT